MSTARQPDPISPGDVEVPARIPASEVKQRGWRGVMKTVREQGAVMVTNHSEPEAVILGVERYRSLLEAARGRERQIETDFDALSRAFDKRLEVLLKADAGDRLRTAMRKPVKLGGKVKAGTGF
ncbi:MAG TPA: type II toxin-antitoxin system prevent-host-death family antitoxin [Candidatus Limnocylindrales bacterium]|nr:type II toxin-antitoxin system prevent-host-death family antitoxin [Candidatus Limnocylindrales bacterium]